MRVGSPSRVSRMSIKPPSQETHRKSSASCAGRGLVLGLCLESVPCPNRDQQLSEDQVLIRERKIREFHSLTLAPENRGATLFLVRHKAKGEMVMNGE